MGRADYQVKIRGFRIELGEIESALNSQPNVREVVVVVRGEGANKRLVAYIVADIALDVEGLRNKLSEQLPDYMIPSAFVELSAMPLTPNGKIDRRALPAPRDVIAVAEAQLPRTPTEEILAAIWQELLGIEQIGIHDDFFEIGGHSLLATQVVSRIRQTLQVELPLRQLFAAPTVAELASQLTSTEHALPPLEPIARLDHTEELPLSFAQQRLWFLGQLEGMSDVYNIPVALGLTGPLDVATFNASLQSICERHELLRTTFPQVDGQARQQIKPLTFKLNLIDLSDLPNDQQKSEVTRLSRQEATYPFDLTTGPLWRVTLLRLNTREHVLLLTMHHIISDGWSIEVLMRELSALYNNARRHSLPTLPVQYADFAVWQRKWLTGEVLEEQLAYWKAQLADTPPLLTLPTDHPRPAVQRYQGDRLSFTLPETLSQALKTLSQKNSTTLFMTLQAAFAVLLSRYSAQEEIFVGTPIANRQVAEVEGLIGFFVNTLVLRNDFSDNPSFRDVLASVRQTALDAYQHQALPFELLVETLQPERSLSHSPLFQVMFTFLENHYQEALSFSDITVTPIDIEYPRAKFDLTLAMEESQKSLIASWEYNTDLFERATTRRMATHFQTLLEGIVANPDQPIAQLPLLTEAERHQLLVEWNETQADYPSDKCIHQLFEQQVARTPSAIAVVFGNQQLTYHELNTRANQLAHTLIAQGVGPEVLVGVCIPRSVETVVGLLGILKAGGAYVPLDPTAPEERLAYLLADAQLSVLLTFDTWCQKLPRHASVAQQGAKLVLMDRPFASITQSNPKVDVRPNNLAYVIYTSGSTGKPKGVLVEHQGLCNSIVSDIRTFGMEPGVRLLHLASFTFDAATSHLFMALCAGATVYLTSMDGQLTNRLKDEAITHAVFPVSILAALPYVELPHLKIVGVGGDVCPPELVTRWGNGRRMFNIYGPTEATITTTIAECVADGQKPSIGRPIANVQVYILDNDLQPMPVGVPGELYIGGVGVARGYLNRPQLTKEKFIANPFGEGRLYKTGDLCRYISRCGKDLGNLEFLGRIDHQVKIRGFRIELGEIEAQLSQHELMHEVLVVVRESSPLPKLGEGLGVRSKRLVAYIVAQEPIPKYTLRAYLGEKLPDYMIPSAFVQLEAMPLTPNGKIDRRALPAPHPHRSDSEVEEPRTPTEEILAAIWQEVLGIEQVGVRDNFFQVGGDSILSIQIVSRAKEAGIHLTPKALFRHQTIADLASAAPKRAKPGSLQNTQAQQGVITGTLPLTPIQHWFLEQAWREPHHFNQSFLLELTEDVNPAWLSEAVQALLTHHDALRLRFEPQGDHWRQEISAPDPEIPFEVIDLSAEGASEQAATLESKANELQASLNLSQGPLLRVALFQNGTSNRLLMVIHHLAVDGVSWRILLEDLERAYQQLANGDAIQLPAKTTSFKQWATLLAENGASVVADEREYWAEPCAEERSISAYDSSQGTALPIDYRLGQNDIASAAHISTRLDRTQTEALLNEVPAVYNTQINDLLLTALVLAWKDTTAQPTLLLELEGHGREELFEEDDTLAVDLSRTVGWFTTIFPVHLEVTTSDLGQAIKRIKEQLRQIPNRGIGYGILRYLHPKGMISSDTLPEIKADVGFNYLGQFDQIASGTLINALSPELSGSPHSPSGQRTHLLDINSMVIEGALQVDWMYSRNFHRAETIQQLANRFMDALEALIAHCQDPDAGGYTPSDFSRTSLSQDRLDSLLAKFG